MAQLELMNALNCITSEAELKEFRDLVANYFAQKAQKAIDALWEDGRINDAKSVTAILMLDRIINK